MRFIFTVACIITFLLSLSLSCKKENLTIFDLRCENLENPIGIDNVSPRFSWKVRSAQNKTEQKFYQLLVASDATLLKKDKADLWDSGKTESPSSVLVPYNGEKLTSGQCAFWKIRIWDEAGRVSPWSPVSTFSIGLLNREDWHASYIGFPTEAGYSECPQLKKTFQLDNPGKQMFLHVNSLGYNEIYINGQKVGEGVLTPAVSQFNKRSLSVTYDVSSLVKKGENNLTLWLGSGWYTDGLPGVCNNGPLVKAQLEELSNNERKIILFTDTTWLGRKSGYTRSGDWRAHHFGGEILDGTVAQIDDPGNYENEKTWEPVNVISVPDYEVSPQMVEQNRLTETIKPINIQSLNKDTFLIDMGRNLTGWTEIHFPKLQKSQEIVLEYCDHLDKDGKFVNQKQIDRYIASGQEPEIFKNKFNYHAYRYIRISNLGEAPSPESITAYLLHTGYELAAGFQCSDPELNKIHDMIFYTLRCLSIGGDLVDCPHIERLGYGGDGNASTETAQTMFNLNPLYRNWLQAWSDCVRDDGGMPHTAPNPYPAGGGPYWCGFIITASWKTFLHYGDSLLLKKHYPTMQKWLEYVDTYTVDGLLKRWPDNDYRGWYLGDWATPDGVDQKAEASIDLVNNCFMVVCYDNMQKIARLLGNEDNAELYRNKKDQLRLKIHQTFYDPAKNSYATGSQIDLTYPLLAEVVPPELVNSVTQSLINEIENIRGGHFACGLVGIPVFTEWAVKTHAVDMMYSMLKKKDYPGYLYMIENGATTTWEHWNGARSHIHNCYNGIGSWFYQAVGGIQYAEDSQAYSKIFIDPQIPKGVSWAKTFKETPSGKIVVNWEINDGKMVIYTEIPVGIDAEIIIPSEVKKYKLEAGEYELTEEKHSVSIKSGIYKLEYSI